MSTAMDVTRLYELQMQLEANGCWQELLDEDGLIRPSAKALSAMRKRHPHPKNGRELEVAMQEARVQTLMDLAFKLDAELN